MSSMWKITLVAASGIAPSGFFLTAVHAAPPETVRLGEGLYLEYCYQCHGKDGSGNGPTAQYLKVKPADLTTISKRANGQFPAARIAEILRYGGDIPGHGPREMPLWGKVFSKKGGGGRAGGNYSRTAVIELLKYVKSIQKK
ncbi:cytochrome c [Hyphomicrobium sp.]|uniref:c-type cytochrome n=1 Tax=Hyphomicrobium sp. TaxID=82 RepID=UPI002D78631F|nr:cytochrome c [Hyphomicrobium sp.]HET6389189.1 cytochrome c [Hyphomicrobium sp.]